MTHVSVDQRAPVIAHNVAFLNQRRPDRAGDLVHLSVPLDKPASFPVQIRPGYGLPLDRRQLRLLQNKVDQLYQKVTRRRRPQ